MSGPNYDLIIQKSFTALYRQAVNSVNELKEDDKESLERIERSINDVLRYDKSDVSMDNNALLVACLNKELIYLARRIFKHNKFVATKNIDIDLLNMILH